MQLFLKVLSIACSIFLVLTSPAKADALDCTAILRDGKEIETYIQPGQTELLYKLEIEKTSQIKLDSIFYLNDSDHAHFQLEDGNGRLYNLGDIHEGSVNVDPVCVPAGNYYLRVSFKPNKRFESSLRIRYSTIPDSDYFGQYYSYEFEDNNQISTANQMGDSPRMLGSILNYQESGLGLGYKDVDYFAVILDERSNIHLDFYSAPGVELALLDSTGNQVRINADPKNDPCILQLKDDGDATGFFTTLNCGVLPAGEYVFKVSGLRASAEGSSYRFDWYRPDSLFSDVDKSTPHVHDINWLFAEGISAGWKTDNGLEYRPYSEVARCDMAAFLYRLAGSPKYTPSSSEWSRFPDVNASTPHAREILWLASVGVTSGYPDGSFKPFATVTRCDMAAFLHRLAGGTPATGSDSFSDVNSSTPHAEDILWLSDAGVSTGFPDGSFKPYATVVRCDMAAFLHRMQGKVIL